LKISRSDSEKLWHILFAANIISTAAASVGCKT